MVLFYFFRALSLSVVLSLPARGTSVVPFPPRLLLRTYVPFLDFEGCSGSSPSSDGSSGCVPGDRSALSGGRGRAVERCVDDVGSRRGGVEVHLLEDDAGDDAFWQVLLLPSLDGEGEGEFRVLEVVLPLGSLRFSFVGAGTSCVFPLACLDLDSNQSINLNLRCPLPSPSNSTQPIGGVPLAVSTG